MPKFKRNTWIGIAVAVFILVFLTIRLTRGESTEFSTAKVTKSDLNVTISATGTLEPEEVVDVGAQVAGQILAFGKDKAGQTVDYGSYVEEGTILARIDDTVYTA